MEQIKNEHLTVTVSAHGAELQSIKDSQGHEYLWQGDAAFWGRRSPILFPIVSRLWQNTYQLHGQELHMTQHGFARDMDFHLIAQGKEQVVYALHDTKETFEKYPFHFNLGISYKLRGNRLHVVWHVENTDDKPILFQIGGHPGFYAPGVEAGQPLKGRLSLDDTEPIRLFTSSNGFIEKGKHATVETHNGIIDFTEDTFKDDALIFDHSQVHRISLLGEDDKPVVTLHFKAPAVGIWSPWGKHAPFVCIEPWYGICDWEGYEGDFADKYMMNQLAPGASFMSEYTITIGEEKA